MDSLALYFRLIRLAVQARMHRRDRPERCHGDPDQYYGQPLQAFERLDNVGDGFPLLSLADGA